MPGIISCVKSGATVTTSRGLSPTIMLSAADKSPLNSILPVTAKLPVMLVLFWIVICPEAFGFITMLPLV